MTMKRKIVGHKTIRNSDGSSKHEPLYEDEARIIIEEIEQADKKRKELMPDENSAVKMLFEAYIRLKELGWNDAVYCPKDGSLFSVLEPGSTGIHDCLYRGKWPDGKWWITDQFDMYPSRPILFKPKTK